MNDLFAQFESQFENPKETEKRSFIEFGFISAYSLYCKEYGDIPTRVFQHEIYNPAMVKAGRGNEISVHSDYIPTDYTNMPQGMKEAQEANGVRNHGVTKVSPEKAEAFKKAEDIFEPYPVSITRTPQVAEENQLSEIVAKETVFDVDSETDGKGQSSLFDNTKETPMLNKALKQSEQVTEVFKSGIDPYNSISNIKSKVGVVIDGHSYILDENKRAIGYTPVWEGMPIEKTKQKVYLGIDPGKQGGMVAVGENGLILKKDVIPLIGTDIDPKGIYDFLMQFKNNHTVVVLEEVHSLFGMSATTNFSMGHTLGIILGIVVSNGFKMIRVAPKTWQKSIWITSEIEYFPLKEGQKKPKVNTKLTSMKAAHRLFPGEDFRKSARSKNDHDGITDSVCLAEYGRRNNL